MSMILSALIAATQPAAVEIDLFATFEAYCVAPFGDRAAVEAVLETNGHGMQPVEQSDMERQMGVQYKGDVYSVTYIQADFLPKDLPSPQCLFAAIGPQADHETLLLLVEERLAAPRGKTKGEKKGRPSTRFDWTTETGEDRRLYIGTAKVEDDGRPVTTFSLMNLRD